MEKSSTTTSSSIDSQDIYKSIVKTIRRLDIDVSQTTIRSEKVSANLQERHIFTGYRLPNQSNGYYLRSLFQLHNESINVWTHLFATILLIYKFVEGAQYVDYADNASGLVVLTFALGAVESAFFSALAHLMHSRSDYHHFMYFQVDYMGVNLNFQGTGIFYLFFSGSEHLYETYGTAWIPVAQAIVCFVCFVAMCLAKVYLPRKSFLSAGINIGQAALLSVIIGIPIAFKAVNDINTGDWHALRVDILPLLLHYVLLASAGVFYACHIPEAIFPGCFDIIGHGHQIFHILLTSLQYYQVVCIIDCYRRRSEHMTRLAAPSVYNTLLPHCCLLLVEVAFLCLSSRLTRRKVQRDEAVRAASKSQ